MSKLKISLNDTFFYVKDCKIARNYSDVGKMFLCLNELSIKQDAVFFDVGANIGIFSLSYLKLYNHSQVFAFEPVPFIYDLLNESIEFNQDLNTRIKTFNFGFSDSEKNLQLSIPDVSQHERYDPNNDINCGLFSVHGKGKEKIDSHFITLDFFVEKNGIERIDFIKVDVEGHEFPVLLGAKNTIQNLKPIIYMEFNDLTKNLSEYSIDSFETFFKKYGYSFYGVQYGWKPDLKPITSLNDTNDISDLVCINK